MTAPPILWRPSPERIERAAITDYARWLERTRGLDLPDYESLWEWSVADLEGFWASIWERFDVIASAPYERVLGSREMPGAEWFPGARLNYAEHVLRPRGDGDVAIRHASELRRLGEVTQGELRGEVARVAGGLRALGVGPGDRVVAYLPNIPEAITAFLACASIGAIWSSCSPDFGARSVIDRFAQITPKVLLAVDGYRYGGKDFDRTPGREAAARIAAHGRAHGRARLSRPEPVRSKGSATRSAGRSCSGWARERRSPSSTCRSIIRCGCSTARARPACRRRSCMATAGSWSRC